MNKNVGSFGVQQKADQGQKKRKKIRSVTMRSEDCLTESWKEMTLETRPMWPDLRARSKPQRLGNMQIKSSPSFSNVRLDCPRE